MRRDVEYQIAKDRVKIGYFTEKGHDIKGVVHVGTNTGYELEWYLKMGIENVIGFEPLTRIYEQCCETYKDAIAEEKLEIVNLALGSADFVNVPFYETVSLRNMEDSGGSTFLREVEPCQHVVYEERLASVMTWDTFVKVRQIDPTLYDCIVIDVQGMELDVLKGMGELISHFKYFNIECSETPAYKGEPSAREIIEWLKKRGIRQETPIAGHDDILFIQEGL